jgi:[acyl-carrier-protein] S-malonyltransferase
VTLAVLCSGQGTQHAAMFELTAQAAAAAPVFQAAAELLGSDPRQWIKTATPSQIYANQSAQLLTCTQALAAWAALDLRAQLPIEELVVAGYSVGELAAWGCAGLLTAADVLRLSVSRAQTMDRAAGSDRGLAAVRGLSRVALDPLCRACECEIAIVLAVDNYIVGGRQSPLQELCWRAMQLGAVRATPLPIAVASHTSLMSAATGIFGTQLRATSHAVEMPSGVRLLSGLDGDAVTSVEAGLEKLARQISQTVDWSACLRACLEAGVTRVLELGPGRALTNLAREAMPDARCRSLEDFRSIDGVREWLAT